MSNQSKLDSGSGYPVFRDMKYGTKLNANITLVNDLKAKYDVAVARLNALSTLNFNRCFNAGGLQIQIGGSANLKTANPVDFQIGNKLYHLAAGNITFTATAQQAASRYCLYLLSIVAAGTTTVTKGTEVATDTAVLPALPASSVSLGYVKVVTGGVTFTGGTTALDAAGVTATYVDLAYPDSGTSAITASSPAIGVVTSAAVLNTIETQG